MKVTVLNGNPDADNVHFDDYLKSLSALLESSNHTVTVLQLREMDNWRKWPISMIYKLLLSLLVVQTL